MLVGSDDCSIAFVFSSKSLVVQQVIERVAGVLLLIEDEVAVLDQIRTALANP